MKRDAERPGKVSRVERSNQEKNSLLATHPTMLVESWVEFIETRAAFFAIGCSVAAGIETDSVLHQKLSDKDLS